MPGSKWGDTTLPPDFGWQLVNGWFMTYAATLSYWEICEGVMPGNQFGYAPLGAATAACLIFPVSVLIAVLTSKDPHADD